MSDTVAKTTANDGTPELHYLDIKMGRGEAVRLFLVDAGIEFKDTRYPYDADWKKTSAGLKEKNISLTGSLPTLDIDGHLLQQHVSILRYMARKLGKYDGTDNYSQYVVDAVSDLYVDWRASWVSGLTGNDDAKKTHAGVSATLFDVIKKYYGLSKGPFLLGQEITYADFLVFQAIDNDGLLGHYKDASPLPELTKAVSARPKIAAYLKADRVVQKE